MKTFVDFDVSPLGFLAPKDFWEIVSCCSHHVTLWRNHLVYWSMNQSLPNECCSMFSFLCSDLYIIVCPSFRHFIVCPSIYGFKLLLLYLQACLIPLHIKNNTLEKGNYRPVSILPMISKTLWKSHKQLTCWFLQQPFSYVYIYLFFEKGTAVKQPF
jgi:hypothetical protein